jgi:hypothetical protein
MSKDSFFEIDAEEHHNQVYDENKKQTDIIIHGDSKTRSKA